MSAKQIHEQAKANIKPRMQCACEPIELREERCGLECASCGKPLKASEVQS